MVYGRDTQIWTIPAEFSSNPNQTHLSMLIRVFKIIRKSQVGEFDQGWRNQKHFFFGWTNVWKHVLIQISLIKNNQVNLINDYILV